MKKKQAVVTAAVAVLAMVIVFLIILFSDSSDTTAQIVLPTQTDAASDDTADAEQADSSFVEISADNVQAVLQTLSRPTCYYQALTVERAWEDGTTMETVQVWKREDLYQIEISAEGQDTLHYLTDGQTLLLWYDGEDTAVQTDLPEGWNVDDLIGIPTWEDALELEAADILDASSAEPGGFAGVSCVYLQYAASDSRQEYIWVSMDSGMLLQAHTVIDGSLTYRMVQTELQTLTATDAMFDGCFILPDGTVFGES